MANSSSDAPTATYQLTDVEAAVRAVKDPLDYLYKEVQFGLRGAVGCRFDSVADVGCGGALCQLLATVTGG